MKELNWKDCFEPAPEAFERSVQRALQTKTEERQMKRIIPRSAIIAFALILVLMATALAFGGDILNFLHTNDIGEVEIQKPDVKVEYAETGILKEIKVDEAVCDGRSVHMLVTWIADPEKGALLWGSDWDVDPNSVPFAAERAAAPKVYLLNPGSMTVETGGQQYDVWDGWHERYDSAYSITADTTFFIDDLELGDTLTAIRPTYIYEYDPDPESNAPAIEMVPCSVTMPVQVAGTRTYEATNLPIKLENYKVNSAKVTRTDLGIYVEVEAEDDYDPEEYENSFSEGPGEGYPTLTLPLHGSAWYRLLDQDGNEIASLTSDQKYLANDDDGEEWAHLLIREMFPVAEIGSSITIQPLDTGSMERFTPYTLELVER
ncbi:hypothetical protein [Aristaeella hokkaidonensis]|uniref:Uncharacterized protein n=1 Tax=Aristaeella hokkaidonensis TaxID=3046382 RepID=A0AC61N5G9_9FIRM|nr:hypothetical protein [Aristaeella hokkaidonensis]QUC66961.1 hypothetical protein JYE49_14160 [Aristaeella hokkaidonensis]SNT94406.1 hypothetical protein SAMN06297421_10563 [Aristaeella hokkaidonensis]